MLTRQVCPKCGHNHILVISTVPDRDSSSASPAKIAFLPQARDATFDSETLFGSLSAAVCRACGFTELYTKEPQSIPVDGKAVTEIVGPKSGGPFR
jgi:predicted nucleic-acid-binding Zn-ribbon protein